MISDDQRREIRRLFYAEHWKIGEIASNLACHHDTVRRALGEWANGGRRQQRDAILVPYYDLLRSTLAEYPRIRATRLLQMAKERGYTGSIYPIRRFVRVEKPRTAKAFQELKFLPGEMAQVDWAHFGTITVGSAERKISCFTMVLAYSRMLFAHMFFDQKMPRVLEGHSLAFDYFGGVPRVLLYDNMKTAVLENLGSAIRFNPELLGLADHYRFKPKACNPRAGWEKGRVERAIRYIRDSFFSARTYSSIEDLNHQLRDWIDSIPPERRWPDDTNKSVLDAYAEENLLELPGQHYPCYEEKSARSSKTCMIHFDRNRYSLPVEAASQWVQIRATQGVVEVYFAGKSIARHTRSWSRKEKIVDHRHLEQIAATRNIRSERISHTVIASHLPEIGEMLLRSWSELDIGLHAGTRQMLGMIDTYGADAVSEAAKQAISSSTPRPESIQHILRTTRDSRNRPELKPRFSPKLSNIELAPRDLSKYDNLGE